MLPMFDTMTMTTAAAGFVVSSLVLRSLLAPVLRSRAKDFILRMLHDADIEVGRDITVHDDAIFLDWVNRGMLAIGESYMSGQWECCNTPLDQVLTKLMKLPSDKKRKLFKSWNAKLVALGARVFNYQSPSRAGTCSWSIWAFLFGGGIRFGWGSSASSLRMLPWGRSGETLSKPC